jgi:uncharacterized protein (DUF362 family)
MKSRRDFLKDAATGAVLLGTQSKLGLAARLDQHAGTGKSKVVVARDAGLHGTGAQPDEKRVLALLDKAMAAYTGREKPVEAWRHIAPPGTLKNKVIGLKVNCVGRRGVSTHLALVLAVCERLQQAGVQAGNIVVWDRTSRALEAAGFSINTDRSRVRCYGCDVSGYEEQPSTWGTVSVNLSKIVTRECDMVLNLPILKDHDRCGVTFSMKNPFGGIEHPDQQHRDNCNQPVADLNRIPAIREKVRFTLGDAISSIYQGGPVFRPEHMWYPNALIVGEDRVAVDYTAWQMLERKRAEAGLPTLEAAGRPARFLAIAADAAHQLGVNDPRRINLMEI